MTTTHPKASDDSVTRTALWALVAVSGVANLVTSVGHRPGHPRRPDGPRCPPPPGPALGRLTSAVAELDHECMTKPSMKPSRIFT